MLTQAVNTMSSHNEVVVEQDNMLLLKHQVSAGIRPFIHPLVLPGTDLCLTQDSPKHHPWQHGIYTGFHGVNGSDFWLDQGDAVGRIEPHKPVIHSSNAWTVNALWRHHQGHGLLKEQQSWSIVQNDFGLILDLDWSLRAELAVTIEASKYGGLFLRMPFDQECDAHVINNHGQENDDCEQAAASWVSLDMLIDEQRVGVAILDHPTNSINGTQWRVDHQRGVNPSPCINQQLTFKPAEERSWRYRILAFKGESHVLSIEHQYQNFACES